MLNVLYTDMYCVYLQHLNNAMICVLIVLNTGLTFIPNTVRLKINVLTCLASEDKMLGIAVSFNKKNFENPAMFRIIHKKGQ